MHDPKPHKDKTQRAICVFCGSSFGGDPVFALAARELGRLIGARGYGFVFGGGSIGLMGEVAREARDAGAPVTGVLPDFLRHLEPPMREGEKLILAASMQERKHKMLALADAFVILPGGNGTIDEFFEVLVQSQLGVEPRPIVLVDIKNYFAPLVALVEHAVANGFAREAVLSLFDLAATPEAALDTVEREWAHAGGGRKALPEEPPMKPGGGGMERD